MAQLDAVAKRRISDVEKQILFLEVEKSKIKRSRSVMLLNKGVMMYFAFILIAVIGFTNGYLQITHFNTIILVGLIVLILAMIPYTKTMADEEKMLDSMIKNLIK